MPIPPNHAKSICSISIHLILSPSIFMLAFLHLQYIQIDRSTQSTLAGGDHVPLQRGSPYLLSSLWTWEANHDAMGGGDYDGALCSSAMQLEGDSTRLKTIKKSQDFFRNNALGKITPLKSSNVQSVNQF